MKRSIGVYIITVGLLLNGGYLFFNAIKAPYMSSFAWSAISITAGVGVMRMTYWSQFILGMLALFSVAGWVDGLIQSYKTGWPYQNTLAETLISLFPGICLVLWWFFASVFMAKTLKKNKINE